MTTNGQPDPNNWNWKTLFPPRPQSRILPSNLPEFELKSKWIIQRKFNGTHVVININKGQVNIITRQCTAPKQFVLTENHKKQFLSLNIDPEKEYWLAGELMNNKTANVKYKNKIVLFDLLQAGKYLFGVGQMDRLELLKLICRDPKSLEPASGIALKVTEDIWLAQHWPKDFTKVYEEFLNLDEIEGVVLRDSTSKLDNFGSKEYEIPWIVRCRKPHPGGNYNF